jgi:hypothetical protein
MADLSSNDDFTNDNNTKAEQKAYFITWLTNYRNILVSGSTVTSALINMFGGQTGSGNVVRAISPELVTPILGTPASGNLINCDLGDETGTGSVVRATSPTLSSPTLVTPALGTPASGTLSSCTVDGTNKIGYLTIPQIVGSGAYTCLPTDIGKHISISGEVTIPTGIFPIGTAITVFANGGIATITYPDKLVLAGTET